MKSKQQESWAKTSCRECNLAVFEDNKQTGCQANRLKKFESIVHSYDDEKEFEPLPLADVEDFVMEFISKIPDLEGLKPVRAQKVFDAISETRFIYEVAIERGLSLYFNNNKEFIHAGLSDEFAEPDYEFVTDSSIIADISAVLSQELPDVAATALNILEVEKEFSSIEGNEYVYNAIFDFNGTEYDAHISANFTIFLISEDDGHQFVDEWRPVTLPDSAKEHILQNYSDLVGPDANYHVEERPSIDGQNKELVAFLDDGTEVIFDENIADWSNSELVNFEEKMKELEFDRRYESKGIQTWIRKPGTG